MFLYRTIISILCIAICSGLGAQSIGKIKKDSGYVHAEGDGMSPASADSAAVRELSLKIAETAGFTSIQIPVRDRLMPGYFNAVRQHSLLITPSRTKAFRFIGRADIPDIFSDRRDKIVEMLATADKAAEKRQADIALRYWKWAISLMKSVPPLDGNKIAETENKINTLLGKLHVRYVRPDRYGSNLIELEFTMDAQPVQSVDYRFFNGTSWSGMMSAKDGRGFAEVPKGASMSKFRVSYEAREDLLPHIWREIKQIETAYSPAQPKKPSAPSASAAPVPATSGNIAKVDYSEVKKKIFETIALNEASPSDSVETELSPVSETSYYENAAEQIRKALASRDYSSVEHLFTEEGADTFRKLLAYGNARALDNSTFFCYRLGDETFARSIPMAFAFPGSGREFLEDIVLTFDSGGKISNITFTLDRPTIKDIASHTGWPEEARIILMNFLENYKTAYALKRLDYIRSIFDENALIITGRVLKNAGKANEYGAGKYVTLTRQNKAEYMKRLETVFASQEFINKFTDCEVMKLGKGPALYGIKIRQEYYSATYSDTGYLFILVDLGDHTKPVIHVRTWQEAPDKDFGIIGPYNF